MDDWIVGLLINNDLTISRGKNRERIRELNRQRASLNGALQRSARMKNLRARARARIYFRRELVFIRFANSRIEIASTFPSSKNSFAVR